MHSWIALAGSTILAVSNAGDAWAAVQTDVEAQASTTSPDSVQPQPDAQPVADIVVTAQRRAETLNRVPIAITVINGASLRETGATQVSDLVQRAPSVQFTPFPGTPVFSVRGISSASFDFGVESAVGLALDGVNAVVRFNNPLNSLADVERIEVLRGPQGLLFGKNTTAGLISITTRRPQLDTYSNEGRMQFGSRNQLEAYDIVNIPLGETAALRLLAGYQYGKPVVRVKGPGQIDDTSNYHFNGKLLWNITDRLTAYAIGDLQDNRGDPGVWTIRSFGAGTVAPAVGNLFIKNQLTALGIVPGPNNLDSGIGVRNFITGRSINGQLTLDYDLGGATLTSVTSYIHQNRSSNLEADSTPLNVYDNNYGTGRAHQFSQELRIASSGTHWVDYVAGLYYFSQKLYTITSQYGTFGYLPADTPILINFRGGPTTANISGKSYAAFAQGTFNLTPRLRLIVGGRYTRDEVSGSNIVTAMPNICSLAYVLSGGTQCQSEPLPRGGSTARNANGWSGRAGVQYDLAERTNIYATASRGYKGPAISTATVIPTSVLPETVQSYEIGLKTELLDRRLSFNIAAFTSKFRNFQAQVFNPAIPPRGTFVTGNAGGVRSRGIEVETVLRPFTGFALSGGVTYLDAKYTNYTPACYAGQTAAMGCSLPGPTFNAAGFPLVYSPKWSTSLAASYHTPLSDQLSLFANGDWSYKTRIYYGIGDPGTIQPGYSLVNGTIGIATAGDRLRFSIFARNLFDKRYAAFILQSFFDAGGYSQIIPDNARRRIGAAVEWKF